jgi:hypothetical protein
MAEGTSLLAIMPNLFRKNRSKAGLKNQTLFEPESIIAESGIDIDHGICREIFFRFDGFIKPFQKTLRTSVKRIIQSLLHNKCI